MPTPASAPAPATGGGSGPAGAPDVEQPLRRKRSAKVQFASLMLQLEAVLVFFATLVAFGLRAAPATTVWVIGGVLVVVLFALSGMVRQPGGYLAGSLVQLPVLATGVAIPMMFVMGGIFVVLWVVALRLGGRIDRERREWDLAHGIAPLA